MFTIFGSTHDVLFCYHIVNWFFFMHFSVFTFYVPIHHGSLNLLCFMSALLHMHFSEWLTITLLVVIFIIQCFLAHTGIPLFSATLFFAHTLLSDFTCSYHRKPMMNSIKMHNQHESGLQLISVYRTLSLYLLSCSVTQTCTLCALGLMHSGRFLLLGVFGIFFPASKHPCILVFMHSWALDEFRSKGF